MSIEIANVTKTFGDVPVLKDVSLKIGTGELVALLGPSGCGKTTLLRIIAGLEQPDPGKGSVRFADQDVTHREVGQRRVGFVFQHYALFRHMSIFENVAYGLRVRPRGSRPPEGDIRRRVEELLGLVQLAPFANRYPAQLSGGQRQRVALARALAVEPNVLLLDEPFGALDAKVRKELRQWLRQLHEKTGITSVFVTHDQDEALEVSDRVAVMNKGRIQQIGSPDEVYDHPASPLVYNFLGNVNRFHGRVEHGRLRIGTHAFAAEADGTGTGERTGVAYARPHEVEVSREHHGRPHLPARVQHVSSAGPVARVYLTRGDTGEPIEAELAKDKFQALTPRPGEQVFVHLSKVQVYREEAAV